MVALDWHATSLEYQSYTQRVGQGVLMTLQEPWLERAEATTWGVQAALALPLLVVLD